MSTSISRLSGEPVEGTSSEQPPLRFITAASLFDGHDAAINIMRRLIQAQGAEVIHLGHNRSVDDIVRAALVQTEWTGDKDSMIAKNADYARQAAEQNTQVMCFQELFYEPYFCQVQDIEYYGYAEAIPDGPTTQRFQALAKELRQVQLAVGTREDEGSAQGGGGPVGRPRG